MDYDVEHKILISKFTAHLEIPFLSFGFSHTHTQKKKYKLNLWFTKWSHFNKAFPAYYMDILVINVFNSKICSKKYNLGLSLLKPIFFTEQFIL